MRFNFKQEHLSCLSEEIPETWVGHNPLTLVDWLVCEDVNSIKHSEETLLDELPDKKSSRDEVREFCRNSDHDPLAKLVMILAWGGIRHPNAKIFFNFASVEQLREIHESLTTDIQTREEAYELFYKLNLKAMGPAYYTKLLYFLFEKQPCYILDRWTAKSACLLADDKFIRFTRKMYVAKTNPPDTYEKYCCLVEELADALSICPSEAEMRMFSEGRIPSNWRSYVEDKFADFLKCKRAAA